jgi:hypothetical protein
MSTTANWKKEFRSQEFKSCRLFQCQWLPLSTVVHNWPGSHRKVTPYQKQHALPGIGQNLDVLPRCAATLKMEEQAYGLRPPARFGETFCDCNS